MHSNYKNPIVSIIVPVYNVEKYLHQCLQTIINQTYTNIEIILINDGSTDNSGNICNAYAQKDNRIKVYHTHNSGLSCARNYGINVCSGDYISFIDSDDYIEENLIERTMDVMLGSKADIVMFGYAKEYVNKTKEKHISQNSIILNNKEALLTVWEDKIIPNFVCTKLYKRYVVSPIFPVRQNYEDIVVMPRWLSKANTIVIINDVLYHYRRNAQSISFIPSPKNAVDHLKSLYNAYCYYADTLHLFTNPKKEIIRVVNRAVKHSPLKIVLTCEDYTQAQPYLEEIRSIYISICNRGDYNTTFTNKIFSNLLIKSTYKYYKTFRFIKFIYKLISYMPFSRKLYK